MNSSTIHQQEHTCWHINVSWGEFFLHQPPSLSLLTSVNHMMYFQQLYLGGLMYMVALILASSLLSCRISKLAWFHLHLACSSTCLPIWLCFLRYFPSNPTNLNFEPVGISCLHTGTISRNEAWEDKKR